MKFSRRSFLKTAAVATSGIAFPTIVPSSVFGENAPSKKINVAQIGCGRIAVYMDLPGVLKHDQARVVAVCDVDTKRLAYARKMVQDHYTKQQGSRTAVAVKEYINYRELLKNPEIDAVAISTPDHWHSEPVIAAALAGKDIYVQKPLSMTVAEGRAVSDIVRKKGRAFQIGSQQRSTRQFHLACELVRNGRIGTLRTIQVGLPTDPGGKVEPDMVVPANLDYDLWLGSTPQVSYTENRVHPQGAADFSRPGWLRIDSYCLGMITGWGSHHVDIAHWGMGTENTGPIEVEAKAEFPKSGLWNVHGPYHVEAKYANGVNVIVDDKFPNGVRFEGSQGWIFVSRSEIKASQSSILESKIGPNEIHLHESKDHHLDWLTSIQTRKPAVTTPEQAHRSTSACIVFWTAMKLGRKLRWNPETERFIGDRTANNMLSRKERAPYGAERLARWA